jgi:hypothetical protein
MTQIVSKVLKNNKYHTQDAKSTISENIETDKQD